jgi:hypothetical protein
MACEWTPPWFYPCSPRRPFDESDSAGAQGSLTALLKKSSVVASPVGLARFNRLACSSLPLSLRTSCGGGSRTLEPTRRQNGTACTRTSPAYCHSNRPTRLCDPGGRSLGPGCACQASQGERCNLITGPNGNTFRSLCCGAGHRAQKPECAVKPAPRQERSGAPRDGNRTGALAML